MNHMEATRDFVDDEHLKQLSSRFGFPVTAAF